MCYYDPSNIYFLYISHSFCLNIENILEFLHLSLYFISNSVFAADGSRDQCNDYESFPSWDNGSVCDGEYEGDVHSDMDDSSTLISQPRQVGFMTFY